MDDHVEYITKSIGSKNIAALMGVDANFILVKICHPTVKRNLQGDPIHITGCLTNVQVEFSMASIDIKC